MAGMKIYSPETDLNITIYVNGDVHAVAGRDFSLAVQSVIQEGITIGNTYLDESALQQLLELLQ